MRLHLVRHGPPVLDPSTSPHDWHLDSTRRDAVIALGESGVLPSHARWLSSDEPKAVETAELLGAKELETLSDLREQQRPTGWVDDYAVRVHRSLVRQDEPAAQGWETSAQTRHRVAAVAKAVLRGDDDEVVMVGHGTAWTLLVSELTGAPVDLAAWERMRLPDHCSIADGVVVSAWGQWRHLVRGTMDDDVDPSL